MHTNTHDVYSVTKRTLLLLRQADVLCALSHTPTPKFPVSPLPMEVEEAQTQSAGTLQSGLGSSQFRPHPSAYLSHVSKGFEDGKLWGLPAPTG